MSEKKHRSLKSLFRHSESKSLSEIHSTIHSTDSNSTGSHRFFLRNWDSKSSSSPPTSGTPKPAGTHSETESTEVTPSATPEYNASDVESTKSTALGSKKKERRKRTDSHHLLRRFFKVFHGKEHHEHPAASSQPRELPSMSSELAEKYDVGRLIGTGASGSVNLITDKHDPTKIYALKKFRSKLKSEDESDYIRKVNNEFLVGEHLRQQNLIHTIELFKERRYGSADPEFFIVMEYCPYDFFNLVMSGLMKKNEIYCYFKQLIVGVNFLHESGIAHRDLKLDNCVVDANGVLKLIDFGSAFQFRKSRDHTSATLLDDKHKLLLAKGIVGSDPYLAPEVFEPLTDEGYDARLADVWSVAIIFCCMVLKRFPWKLPRAADPSYRAYACINSMNQPISEAEKLEVMTRELSMGGKETIPKYGPERLLRILPHNSRELIGLMLEIDTTKRVFMQQVKDHPFVKWIDHCHYVEENEDPQYIQLSGEGLTTNPEHKYTLGVLPSVSIHENLSHSHEELAEVKEAPSVNMSVGEFVRSKNHTHHLVTEVELQKINEDKERLKRAKQAGLA